MASAFREKISEATLTLDKIKWGGTSPALEMHRPSKFVCPLSSECPSFKKRCPPLARCSRTKCPAYKL